MTLPSMYTKKVMYAFKLLQQVGVTRCLKSRKVYFQDYFFFALCVVTRTALCTAQERSTAGCNDHHLVWYVMLRPLCGYLD